MPAAFHTAPFAGTRRNAAASILSFTGRAISAILVRGRDTVLGTMRQQITGTLHNE